MLLVGEFIALLGIVAKISAGGRWLELGVAETGPHSLHRLERMGQIDIFRALECAFVKTPERILFLRLVRRRAGSDKRGNGDGCDYQRRLHRIASLIDRNR